MITMLLERASWRRGLLMLGPSTYINHARSSVIETEYRVRSGFRQVHF